MSMEMEKQEELLTEMKNRFVLFPIRYKSIWDMYKKAESAFWTAGEIDITNDKKDWENLKEDERFFIKRILAFFAGSDGIVNENLALRFMNEVKPAEAKAFYGFQIAMENIHCVSEDTEVLTDKGYVKIKNVEDNLINVWNGERFSIVRVKQTHESAPAFRVETSNGMYLTCTPNHEWLIDINGEEHRIKTCDLRNGMRLWSYDYPNLERVYDHELFSNIEKHGYTCGLQSVVYNHIEFNCRPHLFVPCNFGVNSKIEWLNGLFKHFNFDKNGNMFKLQHWHEEFIHHLQLLFSTFGAFSTVKQTEICLDIWQVKKLVKHGMIVISDEITNYVNDFVEACPYTNFDILITSIEDLKSNIPMYCFEEPFRHTGVFNGILTGQSEMYSLLIDTYIKDPQEKNMLLDAIHTIPCIEKKAKWAIKWISDKECEFAKRLLAFAVVEGIFFSGAFCSIFWLKERGVMPGLCLSNEFISRDESLHTEFAILLYSMLKNKLDQSEVHDLIKEAVDIEDEFITDSIPCSLLGMNSTLMSQYIRFVADRLLVQLGYDKIFNVQNPFHFMDRISLSSKTNFFEHRVSEYARPSEKPEFSVTDDDF